MECHYCRGRGGQHQKACPTVTGKTADYERGYEDGRNRRPIASEDPTYGLGWVYGDSYADERENREPDPYFM